MLMLLFFVCTRNKMSIFKIIIFRFSRGSSTENNKKKSEKNSQQHIFFPSLRFIKSSLFSWHVCWSSLKMSLDKFHIFPLTSLVFLGKESEVEKVRRGMKLMERQLIKNQLIRKTFAWMLPALDNENFFISGYPGVHYDLFCCGWRPITSVRLFFIVFASGCGKFKKNS